MFAGRARSVFLAGVGEDGDPGPGVIAVAFRAATAGVGLAWLVAEQGGDGVDAQHPCVGADPPVRGDLQHVTEPQLANSSAQRGVGALDLVPGHPRRRRASRDRAADHRGGQRRLGRELDLRRHPGPFAALVVAGPGLRHVKRPVDQGVPARCGVGQRSRSGPRCRCIAAAPRPTRHPDSGPRSHRPPGPPARRRTRRSDSRAGPHARDRRPSRRGRADAAIRAA